MAGTYIDDERAQAEQWSIRLAGLEELGDGSSHMAQTFRELIDLCDTKIRIMKELEERGNVMQQLIDLLGIEGLRQVFDDEDESN